MTKLVFGAVLVLATAGALLFVAPASAHSGVPYRTEAWATTNLKRIHRW